MFRLNVQNENWAKCPLFEYYMSARVCVFICAAGYLAHHHFINVTHLQAQHVTMCMCTVFALHTTMMMLMITTTARTMLMMTMESALKQKLNKCTEKCMRSPPRQKGKGSCMNDGCKVCSMVSAATAVALLNPYDSTTLTRCTTPGILYFTHFQCLSKTKGSLECASVWKFSGILIFHAHTLTRAEQTRTAHKPIKTARNGKPTSKPANANNKGSCKQDSPVHIHSYMQTYLCSYVDMLMQLCTNVCMFVLLYIRFCKLMRFCTLPSFMGSLHKKGAGLIYARVTALFCYTAQFSSSTE